MKENGVTLKLKSSWKWGIYISEIIAVAGFMFLLVNLINVVGMYDVASIFLLIVFAGWLVGCILSILFVIKHKVQFIEDGIVRKGVFRTRFFPFGEVEAIWFAPRFWDVRSGISPLSNSSTLVFDYRYKDIEQAVEFIKQKADLPECVSVYYDQERVVSG